MSEFIYEQTGDGLVLTGIEGSPIHASVPAEADGRPVTAIGRYAFSGQSQLKSVSLPADIREIGTHAFYNCRNLEQLTLLGSGVRSVCDGAFKNCKKLKTIFINGMQYLNQLLPDITTEITLVLHLEDNQEIQILFPEYDFVYQEFVQPRLYQSVPYGSGSHYRMCVSPARINFNEYDKAFSHSVVLDEPETVMTLALYRLRYPVEMLDTAREKYISYLKEQRFSAAELLLKRRDFRTLETLLSLDLFTSDELQEIITGASVQEVPEAVSLMMDYKLRRFGGRKKRFVL